MKAVLTGYNTFYSKKKEKDLFQAHLIIPFTSHDRESGCSGRKATAEYISKEIYDKLTPAFIDKEVELDYDISGFRAYLQGIELVK